MSRSAAPFFVAAFALIGAGERSVQNAPKDLPLIAAEIPAAAAIEPPAPEPEMPTPPPSEPAFDDVPWSTGIDVGTGVAMKDTGNPRGKNAFIAYAGYRVSMEDAEAWASALYRARLRDRGVRYVWAVRGPDDSHYENKEIGNTKIGAKLREIAPDASFILVAAHSSGSCVAHELFKQLAEGRDPEGVTRDKIVYFNLDGIEKGLTFQSTARLRRAYFVGAVDRPKKTVSPNEGEMRRTAELYLKLGKAKGDYIEYDAREAGCADGGSWCLHVTLVTNRPHDTRAARAHLDYSDFEGRDVATAVFDMKAEESGL